MSKKLAAKASLIQLPPLVQPSVAPGASQHEASAGEGGPPTRAKTAPGSMAQFMVNQSAAVREAEVLKDRLKAFEGAKPVRMLDPKVVHASRWANRHERSFQEAAFEQLKVDIASSGTNVQPVSVRPVAGEGGGDRYELIFGHRRHRACLELGLPLQAMVVEATDHELFEAMDRENRARKNLSAWEQGVIYRRALDEGLYASQRKLSEALGVDVALVSKSLSLARLPEAVIAAFPNPLEIQFRWAQPLAEALQKDPDGMLARAAKLQVQPATLSAAQVLDALTRPSGSEEVLNGSTSPRQEFSGREGRRALVQRGRKGDLRIDFKPGALDDAAERELMDFLKKLLERQ